MSDRDRIPELPPMALAEAATEERLERVWKRLEGDLGAAETPGLVRSRARRRRDLILLAPAAVVVFTSGVLVGHEVKIELQVQAVQTQEAAVEAVAAI